MSEADNPQTISPTWMERMSARAAKKSGMKNWHAWIYSAAAQGGLLVTGAVCPPITRGERKGKPNYRKADRATQQIIYLSKRECR